MSKQLRFDTAAREAVGDGTTTSTLLAQAIFAEGVKNVTAGVSAIDLKRAGGGVSGESAAGGEAMRVRDAMTWKAETIGPGESLQAAARRMRELDVGALVVCDGDQVVGVLTDRDIVVRSLAEGANPADAEVRAAMTAHVVDCREDDELEGAAARMAAAAVRRLVVLDAARRLVGVLSLDDVALRSPALAGEIVEHVRAPERHLSRRGPWPWWESPGN